MAGIQLLDILNFAYQHFRNVSQRTNETGSPGWVLVSSDEASRNLLIKANQYREPFLSIQTCPCDLSVSVREAIWMFPQQDSDGCTADVCAGELTLRCWSRTLPLLSVCSFSVFSVSAVSFQRLGSGALRACSLRGPNCSLTCYLPSFIAVVYSAVLGNNKQ